MGNINWQKKKLKINWLLDASEFLIVNNDCEHIEHIEHECDKYERIWLNMNGYVWVEYVCININTNQLN